jgi:fatty acid desaturase
MPYDAIRSGQMRRGILGDLFLIQRMHYYGMRERQRRSRGARKPKRHLDVKTTRDMIVAELHRDRFTTITHQPSKFGYACAGVFAFVATCALGIAAFVFSSVVAFWIFGMPGFCAIAFLWAFDAYRMLKRRALAKLATRDSIPTQRKKAARK